MKKACTLFALLLSFTVFAQWEYRINQEERRLEAVSEIQFKDTRIAPLTLMVSKSRKLGIDVSLNGSFFNQNQEYYVLFELGDQKIRVAQSLEKKQGLRLLEFKNLIDNEEYDSATFIKILKAADYCTISLRSNSKVIQGETDLSGSTYAINEVLRGQFP